MRLPLPLRQDGLRNLGSAAGVQDDSRLGVDEEATLLAAEERLRQQPSASPSYPGVELPHHAVAAALALAVRLVERVLNSSLRGQFINVPFDELQVELGV